MRATSPELAAHIAQEVTTLARLWRITRKDGAVLRFTDAVRDIVFDGDTYRADISFTTSAIFTSASAASSQNVSVELIMDDDGLKEGDLRARRYDSATGEIMAINYKDPSMGVISLYTGTVGTVTITDKRRATIELLPANGALGRSIGSECFSQTCRADLGDARCKVDIEALKVAFTVTSASGGSLVADAFTQATNSWALGFVKWLTGANAGTTSPIASNAPGSKSIFLASPPFNPIVAGDTGSVYPGCDKTLQTCRDKFNNVVNIRAEPQVPTGATSPTSFSINNTSSQG